jgi:DnaK suppressor protein
MPDELTTEQLAGLRQTLEAIRLEIEAQLEATREDAKPVDLDEPIGRLTRMDAMQQQNMTKASRRGLEARLQQVAGALGAVKDGDYGFCRRCEEPIGYARLRARPETGLCVACQERLEAQR